MASAGDNDPSTSDRRRLAAPLLILLAGLLAGSLMYYITPHGAGVTTDSTKYIETARNVLAGNGFCAWGEPTTHYPPVYPLLLAAAALPLQGDLLQAARDLAALLFGVNLALFALAACLGTGRSLVATLCAILLYLSSAPVIEFQSMALSEAAFMTFALAAFLLLALHLNRPAPHRLVLAALMAGLAMCTRYAGVALLPPMIVAMLIFGGGPMRRRLAEAVLGAGVAALPLACWLIRNVMVAQTATDRDIVFHPLDDAEVQSFIDTIHKFAFPFSMPYWTQALVLSVAAIILVVAVVLLYSRRGGGRLPSSMSAILPSLWLLFCPTYLAVLVLSISLIDAHTHLDERILLPFYLASTLAAISLAWSLSRALDRSYIRHGFLILALVLSAEGSRHAVQESLSIRRDGRGYTARRWHDSEILPYLARVHDGRRIYSNGADAVRFLTGQKAEQIPHKVSPWTRRPNLEYEEEMRRIAGECARGEALVAHLHGIDWRWYHPTRAEMESKLHLSVQQTFRDGVVYVGVTE